jgi:hypothetical protein
MMAKKLEDEAWRLIEAARFADGAGRRRLLIDEAFDLIKRAKELRELDAAEAESLAPALEGYKLWFTRGDGATLWIDLNISSRADALWAADALAAACAEQYEEFELWQGPVYLFGASTRYSQFSLQTAVEVSRQSQQSVLETEEALLESHNSLARSRKLLAATAQLRQQLADPHAPRGRA